MSESCLYRGWVRHRRSQPLTHGFRYRVQLLYLDLDELPELLRGGWPWFSERPALAWFRRADYLDPSEPSLAEAVRKLVERRLGRRPTGPLRLLTHPRYLGYVFNPVSFYYCYQPDGRELDALVAEITNTPWGERHSYVLDARAQPGAVKRFRFQKDFHVSPFMGMDMQYDWRFTKPGRSLVVHTVNLRHGRHYFDATLSLRRQRLSRSALLRRPLETPRVMAAIYWQALKLQLKGAGFHPHPRSAETAEPPEPGYRETPKR